ncbi:MAG: stringent starvation protein A [Candidatus Binatia bacterium]|nr:MAG: stringent starvation protein A [Candidatus Binatia bacterium]
MRLLYDYPDCPYGQKVRVVLAEKELPYDLVTVDLKKNEQRSPEFLRKNPYGKVPVLEDEDVIVYESTIINEYLQDEYPYPPVMPDDSASRAKVRWLEDYSDSVFLPRVYWILCELEKPEGERDAARIEQYRNEIRQSLGWLQSQFLQQGAEFLVGDFSLADIAFVPGLLVLSRLGVTLDPAWQALHAWIERLRVRPSVRVLGLSG